MAKSIGEQGAKDLDATLSRLSDQDLGEWDRDFVDDMAKRLSQWWDELHITGPQWAQIERMKGRYL